jgi:hypothetical protein
MTPEKFNFDFQTIEEAAQPRAPQQSRRELPTEMPIRKKMDEITCHDCRRPSELGGYCFALVPVCECCQIEREVQITGNRFERRMKR